jgi:hypothetical protein
MFGMIGFALSRIHDELSERGGGLQLTMDRNGVRAHVHFDGDAQLAEFRGKTLRAVLKEVGEHMNRTRRPAANGEGK